MSSLTTYFTEGLDLAIAFANLTSRQRSGILAPYPPTPKATMRVRDPATLSALSEQVRAIVTQSDPAQAAPLLNSLLRQHRAAPELAADPSGHWRLHLHPADSDAEGLDAVKAAASLAELMDRNEWGTLKTCAAADCDDLFLDRSRNHARAYCTRTCANRINAIHSRARRAIP
jgi:predicted RNA-binding Zn ribbon-like protein